MSIVAKYNEYENNYDNIIKVISDIIDLGVITEGTRDLLDEAYTNYNESYTDIKNDLENINTETIEQKIESVNNDKINSSKEEILSILSDGGINNTIYLDDEGRLYIDGEYIPDLQTVKFTVDEQAKTIEGLIADGYVDVDGENVKLNLAYTQLKQTVNSIDQTVANVNTNVDTLSENISKVSQKANSITQTVADVSGNVDTLSGNITNLSSNIDTLNSSVSQIKQTSDKIEWIVASGNSKSDMQLTDEFFKLTTDKVMITAKNMELNGSVNINDGLFTISANGVLASGKISQDNTTRCFVVNNNGNLKIGGTTGRLNGDGTVQGIFEITSFGKLWSRNLSNENIYTTLDDGKIEIRNEDIRIKINNDGIQIKNMSDGGELTMSDNAIIADNLSISGKLLAQKGIQSNSYLRGSSLVINNQRFATEINTINGSNQSICFLGSTMIIYGRTSFTGLTAKETKVSSITFNQSFTSAPFVMAIPNSSSPHQCRVGVGSVATTGCNIYLNRTNTTDTNVFWIAIGERAASDNFTA